MPHSLTARSIATDLDDYRWLTGVDARAVLEATAASSRSLTAEITNLRRKLSPARSHLVVEQVNLRRRARAKFAGAERMFFTPRGLEQATDEIVAAHKARRFAESGAVFDLCCGIGGDLLALARNATTTGVDRDPIMAIVAAANARVERLETDGGTISELPAVRALEVADVDVGECTAWHIDPDRRPMGRRTTRVTLHEPGVEAIEQLLARNQRAAIKLAPAAKLPDAWIERAELEWIGRDRQCRQLVAWFGELAREPGQRRATVLGSHAETPRSIVGVPCDDPPATGRVGSYLFEPDAAVLAAKLATTLAAEHGIARITAGIAYWTGDHPIDDPAMSCFKVWEVLPLDLKRVRELLAARQIGRLEIKKRGVDCQPEKIRRHLRLSGSRSGTLLVARIGGRVTAIVAQRHGVA